MTREFIYTKPFRDSWKNMGLHDEDLKQLEKILLENLQMGDVIQGTGGVRKLRIQLEGRGKSDGGRVIYLDVFLKEKGENVMQKKRFLLLLLPFVFSRSGRCCSACRIFP